MKNFIRKSLVVTFMALPLLAQAGMSSCGQGTIKGIRFNAFGQQDFAMVLVDWDVRPQAAWYDDSVLVRYAPAIQAAHAAFLSGTHVRFLSKTGNQCPNVDEVMMCKNKETCDRITVNGVY